jgi:hypothetical protein
MAKEITRKIGAERDVVVTDKGSSLGIGSRVSVLTLLTARGIKAIGPP